MWRAAMLAPHLPDNNHGTCSIVPREEAPHMKQRIAVIVAFVSAAAISDAHAQAVVLPISKEGVVLKRDDLIQSVQPKDNSAAVGLAPAGAIRAGDDRIMVDVLRRAGTTAENPVVHDVVTEIYNIIEGSGEIELGGVIADPKPMLTNGAPTNPANIGPSRNGTHVSGGKIHSFGPGDQIMIPPGTAHRFVKLNSPVIYSVVRVNPDYEKDSKE